MRRPLPLLIALAMLASGCLQAERIPVTPTITQTGLKTVANSALTGQLLAPASVISAGGGNVINAGGGNVINAGGGNYRVLGLSEQPFANQKVHLARLDGTIVSSVAAVKTDAQGRFRFAQVPVGQTFLVVASVKSQSGKNAVLQTLVTPKGASSTAEISAASTMVATSLLNGNQRDGNIDATQFSRAVKTLADKLTEAELPDFSDRASILARMDQLSQQIAELQERVDQLAEELAKSRATPSPAASASPGATASPEASASPDATPTPGATASASATPTPTPSASASAGAATPTPTPTPASGGSVTSLTGEVTTAGHVNGPLSAARFNSPVAIVFDAAGAMYVSEVGNRRIRRIGTDGQVSSVAGSGASDLVDGTGTSAKFAYPCDMAVAASGVIYVLDRSSSKPALRQFDPATGAVTTLAGGAAIGYADGTGTAAQFNMPNGLALGADGSVYVADTGNKRIRKVDPATGTVTTVAGTGTAGYDDGPAGSATFTSPLDVAVDGSGAVFVADGYRLRKIAGGSVSTVSGASAGYRDGAATSAQFQSLQGLAFDAAGNLFLSENADSRVRKLALDGTVSTVVGTAGEGFANGDPALAKLHGPRGLAFDGAGNLYIADTANNALRRLAR